jgi:hypothetical protein
MLISPKARWRSSMTALLRAFSFSGRWNSIAAIPSSTLTVILL